MYHSIEDQEKHPENYVLKDIDLGVVEDECFYLLSKPRQTQRTIGLYLKKIKNSQAEPPPEDEGKPKTKEKKKFPLTPGDHNLESKVQFNKGFWVERPERAANLLNKIKEKFSVEIPKTDKTGQGVFYRAKNLELEFLIKLAQAGKLKHGEEETEDSEEETEFLETECEALRKPKYKICDPCEEEKPKKEKPALGPPKDLIEELKREGRKPPFKKIPAGCQCDYYWEHTRPVTVWDTPHKDRLDMLRQHEMNKWLKSYKHELLNKFYKEHPPVKFMAHEPGMKRTFPIFQISNL